MKLQGFIGPAYKLDSLNVEAQQCVNLYPEMIESGMGKEGEVAYLKPTPGLTSILDVGSGPIRLIHVDSIGRIFVVSSNKLYRLSKRSEWLYDVVPTTFAIGTLIQGAGTINTATDTFTIASHGFYTGLKVQVSTSSVIPTGLAASTDYWISSSTTNTFTLSISLSNALSSIAVDVSGVGAGTLTVTPQIPSSLTDLSLIDTVLPSIDSFVKESHGFYTGLKVQVTTTATPLPGGLISSTDYFVIKLDGEKFRLASSISNASSATAIDITATSSADWAAVEVTSDGSTGGSTVTLGSSTGPVRAASMSFGGDGTDSSTIFVDGENNYLYQQDGNVKSFKVLGTSDIAKATYTVSNTFSIWTSQNVSTFVGKTLQIEARSTSIGTNEILLIASQTSDTNFVLHLFIDASTSLTSAQFVQYLNTGAVTGKTFLTIDQGTGLLGTLQASGGGADSLTTTFPEASGGTAVTMVADTVSGFGYGSIPTATHIDWIDGYFIVNEGATNKFWVSDLASFNINSLSFASSEGDPDVIMGLIANYRDLWVFNEKTTEIYINTGNTDFPFERVQGGFLETGCLAKYSIAKIDGKVFWLGRSKEGQGIVYSAQGLTAQRISTHAIEQSISSYADPSTATAFTYQSGGHKFYVLNFDEATWVYDLSTNMWHERAYTNDGQLERHRSDAHAFSYKSGIQLVGDYETASVYQLDESVKTDNGSAITRLRSSPHTSNDLKRLFCSKFQLDMEVGIGLDGGVQGSQPAVIFDYSDDGGHTWSNELLAYADRQNEQVPKYKTRLIWRRLGKFRDRIFRVKITDPVDVVLLGAHLDVTPGAS